jgi:uncharacterized protein (DUF1778 family)
VTQKARLIVLAAVVGLGVSGVKAEIDISDHEQMTPRQRRARSRGHRTNRVNLRLSDDEWEELDAAAARTGETPAGYAARAALAMARNEVVVEIPAEKLLQLLQEMQHSRMVLGHVSMLLSQVVSAWQKSGTLPYYRIVAVERCALALRNVEHAARAVLRALGTRRVGQW